jgi:hypothetical protein
MLSVIAQFFIVMLSVITQFFIVMLSVIIQFFIVMLSVIIQLFYCYAECHYAELCYDEYRGASLSCFFHVLPAILD